MMSVCVILSAAAHGRPYWDQEANPRVLDLVPRAGEIGATGGAADRLERLASASYEASHAKR
jgi:hypothetical protein